MASGFRHGADYIDRTIATVRNHRDADNCWPQWANIFADEIEHQRAEVERLRATLSKIAGCERRVEGDVVDVARKELLASFTRMGASSPIRSSPIRNIGPECKALRQEGDTGPDCGCTDGACALGLE